MALANVFYPDSTKVTDLIWSRIPLQTRMHYNFLLGKVVEIEATQPYFINGSYSYYNNKNCLALSNICTNKPVTTLLKSSSSSGTGSSIGECIETGWDAEAKNLFIKPTFSFLRDPLPAIIPGGNTSNGYGPIHDITCGALIWLYFYERMGIFKIIGALLDDYNYAGKYSLSYKGASSSNSMKLLEILTDMYRSGYASTKRDRVSTYKRVLGIDSIDTANADIETNSSFLRNFSKLITDMLSFYKNRQLTQAIQNTSTSPVSMSPVSNLTLIKDDIISSQQNMEPLFYGRNFINIWQGIATVYAGLTLIKEAKSELGIPAQFDTPDKFIPAAYDLLVLNRAVTNSENNRFTLFDNCATYGYRMLTDIQNLDPNNLNVTSYGSALDIWVTNVEGYVEGYNNAFKAIKNLA